MITKVGFTADNPGRENLVDLTVPRGPLPAVMYRSQRPTALPHLTEGHRLLCGYDRGFGEELYLVETLEDVQQMWDWADVGGVIVSPVWYSAPILYVEAN